MYCEDTSFIKFRCDRHGAAQPANQGADMGKANSLTRLVLHSGAPEQGENALVILGLDPAPVIGDLEDRISEFGAGPHRYVAGNTGLEVFECVVDQIGENLLQREAVAGDFGQRFDADLGLRLRRLMRNRRDDRLDQFSGVDPDRIEFAPSLAGKAKDGRNQPVHLGDRRFDEFEGFGKTFAQLLVIGVQHAFDAVAVGLWRWGGDRGKAQGADPLENIAAQLLEFAGEAHDIDQRRAKIVADDIGKALNFVVGLAKIDGAFIYRGFQVEVVVEQLCFGLVACASRTANQKNGKATQQDDES